MHTVAKRSKGPSPKAKASRKRRKSHPKVGSVARPPPARVDNPSNATKAPGVASPRGSAPVKRSDAFPKVSGGPQPLALVYDVVLRRNQNLRSLSCRPSRSLRTILPIPMSHFPAVSAKLPSQVASPLLLPLLRDVCLSPDLPWPSSLLRVPLLLRRKRRPSSKMSNHRRWFVTGARRPRHLVLPQRVVKTSHISGRLNIPSGW